MIINNTIAKYEGILNNMPENELNLFRIGLNKMREFGVEDFGYRSINERGESNIFSTSLNWHKINKNTKFLKCLSQHISSEILYAKKHNLNFFTRSGDKVYTPYLKCLERFGINNSVVALKFGANKIEVFYFLTNSERPHCRDIISNNLKRLNDIVDKMEPVFKFLNDSTEFQNDSNKILDNDTIKLLWRDDSKELVCQGRYIRLIYKDREIFLSPQLLRCLLQLKPGISNGSIANRLELSVETVKDHIEKLREKFQVGSKVQLVEIIQSEEMQYLNHSKNINELRKAI